MAARGARYRGGFGQQQREELGVAAAGRVCCSARQRALIRGGERILGLRRARVGGGGRRSAAARGSRGPPPPPGSARSRAAGAANGSEAEAAARRAKPPRAGCGVARARREMVGQARCGRGRREEGGGGTPPPRAPPCHGLHREEGCAGTEEGAGRSAVPRRRSWRPPAATAALVGEERGESDEEDIDIEDEKTQGLFLHIFMLLEGLWT